MPARWDNIDILKTIDRQQQEMYGGGALQGIDGLALMRLADSSVQYDAKSLRGFTQELRIAFDAGLITCRSHTDTPPNLHESDPNWYLQTIYNFALTVKGQDRARGRIIAQPPVEPHEDDGRMISALTLQRIATAIMDEYSPDEVDVFLGELGLPPAELHIPENTQPGDARTILGAVWRHGSEGRRLIRRFVGNWLDDRLLSGPDAELRAQLIEQLARQGWRIRDDDATLVITEPVRGVPISATFLRASRLHALVEAQARPQFLINRPGQGVFAAMKEVEIRVRKLSGFNDAVVGVDLMNKAFGPSGPLTDLAAPKGEQEGTRAFFAGSYALLRNPAGHLHVDYEDLSEAAEAVQTASLLMRLLDRVEDRLLAAARHATRRSALEE